MDSFTKTLNNLSLYEVKAYARKAQNAVLNLSEMEAKVREATNNEPWGAPTSKMAEIARGTFNYKDREEVCSMIFRRFTEKSAHEWRQIYKSLQLMEYLVKHGSERFVDDARANVSLVTMLKSFHYIDSKGVDQGINVRNRARELGALLNDEVKIRQERKKAKENAKKFGAVSSSSGYTGSSSRRSVGASATSSSADVDYDYEDDSGYAGRVFGDGGVFGERFEDQRPTGTSGSQKFEEYDIEATSSSKPSRRTSKPTTQASSVTASSQPPVDLFSFGDEPISATTATAPAGDNDFDDDEFDDFQSATPAAPQQSNNLADLFASSYSQPSQTSQQQFQPQQQIYEPQPTVAQPAVSQPKKKDDIFGSLLVSAKSSAHKPSKPFTEASQKKPSSAVDDDMFGSFAPLSSSSAAPPATSTSTSTQPQQSSSSSNGGVVDLLSF